MNRDIHIPEGLIRILDGAPENRVAQELLVNRLAEGSLRDVVTKVHSAIELLSVIKLTEDGIAIPDGAQVGLFYFSMMIRDAAEHAERLALKQEGQL